MIHMVLTIISDFREGIKSFGFAKRYSQKLYNLANPTSTFTNQLNLILGTWELFCIEQKYKWLNTKLINTIGIFFFNKVNQEQVTVQNAFLTPLIPIPHLCT